MYNLLQSSRAARWSGVVAGASLLAFLATSCAEGGEEPFEELDAGGWSTSDATVTTPTVPTTPWPQPDAWTPGSWDAQLPDVVGNEDASMSGFPDASSPDATVDAGGFLGGLLGGGGDAGIPDSSAPPASPGGWKLKQGSAAECPEEPPPLPLIGGLCLGVYWSCSWENAQGQSYFCVCDWVHYLCL